MGSRLAKRPAASRAPQLRGGRFNHYAGRGREFALGAGLGKRGQQGFAPSALQVGIASAA